MKATLLAAATLCFGVIACGGKTEFTGKWKGLNTSPGVAMELDVTRNGDAYRVEQVITTTLGSGQPIISRESLNGTTKDDTLQIANGLATLSIDKTSGHLMAPGMASVTEFERVSGS